MKNLLFLLASLVVAPLFAQPMPYVALDTTLNLPTVRAAYQGKDIIGILPDNSFIIRYIDYTSMGTYAVQDTAWVMCIGADGTVRWQRDLGKFFPIQAIPGPGSNLTLTGLTHVPAPGSVFEDTFGLSSSWVLDPQGSVVSVNNIPVINSDNCGFFTQGFFRQDPYGYHTVRLPDGNFIAQYYIEDSTAPQGMAMFTLRKISPLGQILWSHSMPQYEYQFGGLALSGSGNVLFNGLYFNTPNDWSTDNAAFTVAPDGSIVGSRISPRPQTRAEETPFNDWREGFHAANNNGSWVWTGMNQQDASNSNFPVVRLSETCDTLFASLVPYMGDSLFWSTPVYRWAKGAVATPDNGMLFMVYEKSKSGLQTDGYLLKLRADGSFHWRSYQAGISPNTGTFFYLTTDGDLMQVDKNTVRLTRWHIPVGTGVAEAVAQPALSVSPNPVKDVLTATFSAPIAGQITLAISDLSGRQFLSQPMQAVAGANTGQLSVAALAPGMYVLSAAGATGVAAQTVFVKE